MKTEVEPASETQCFSVEKAIDDGQDPRKEDCLQMLYSVYSVELREVMYV